MAKILLVEDDTELSKKLTDWLELQHHKAEAVGDGTKASELLRLCEYDLIILDWDLPGLSGIELLREYRNNGGRTPVLMLTGKDDLDDIERGLNVGADDYLTKPFAFRELGARANALTRRENKKYQTILKLRGVELNTETHQVFKDGAELKLQPQEFALLEFLLKHPDEMFSVEALLQRVWSSETEASPDTVRVCITRLRNKIDTPGASSIIKTVHRVGYRVDSGE